MLSKLRHIMAERCAVGSDLRLLAMETEEQNTKMGLLLVGTRKGAHAVPIHTGLRRFQSVAGNSYAVLLPFLVRPQRGPPHAKPMKVPGAASCLPLRIGSLYVRRLGCPACGTMLLTFGSFAEVPLPKSCAAGSEPRSAQSKHRFGENRV